MTLIRQAPFFTPSGYPPIPIPLWEIIDGPNAGLLFLTSVRWDNPQQTPVHSIDYSGRHIIPNTQPVPVLAFPPSHEKKTLLLINLNGLHEVRPVLVFSQPVFTTASPEKVPENVLF